MADRPLAQIEGKPTRYLGTAIERRHNYVTGKPDHFAVHYYRQLVNGKWKTIKSLDKLF